MYANWGSGRRGLGAPADWVIPDQGVINNKYVNMVLLPDGNVVGITSVYDKAPSPAVLAEWQAHAAQNAWAFEAAPAGGDMLSLTYRWTGAAPSAGTINVTGGQGLPSGATQTFTGTITPTTARITTSDGGPAPSSVTAPAPSNLAVPGGGGAMTVVGAAPVDTIGTMGPTDIGGDGGGFIPPDYGFQPSHVTEGGTETGATPSIMDTVRALPTGVKVVGAAVLAWLLFGRRR